MLFSAFIVRIVSGVPLIVPPERRRYLPSAAVCVSAPTSEAVGQRVTYLVGATFSRASHDELRSLMVASDTEVRNVKSFLRVSVFPLLA